MPDAVCVVQSPQPRSPKKQGPRSGVNRLSRLTQALDLQDILTSVAKALRSDLESTDDQDKRARLAVAIASTGRSWQGLQGEIMAIRGQGRPKSVEARNATTKRKPRAPIAPIAIEQAQARDASRPPATPVSPPDAT